MATVSIVRKEATLTKDLARGLEPFKERIRNAKTIVLKPAITANTRALGEWVITSAGFCEALIKALRKHNPGVVVRVVESDTREGVSAANRYRVWGFNRLEKLPRVKLVELTRDEWVPARPEGLLFEELQTPKTLLTSDLTISVAKVKTHNLTKYTGALKNMFGCIPLPNKEKFHPFLDEAIVDINAIVRAGLCVLDAAPAMQGNGPLKGSPLDLGCYVIGDDLVASDALGARMLGINPRTVRHLRLAERAGLGTMDVRRVRVLGRMPQRKAELIPPAQRASVKLSLFVQRLGFWMHELGHKLTTAKNPLAFIITLYVYLRKILTGKFRIRA